MGQFAKRKCQISINFEKHLTDLNYFLKQRIRKLVPKKLRKITYKYFLKKCQKDVDFKKNVCYIINALRKNLLIS